LKVVVLGANGMIGSAMLSQLTGYKDLQVLGIVRDAEKVAKLCPKLYKKCKSGFDLTSQDQIVRIFFEHRPDVVINCAGVTKHLLQGRDYISALSMNSLLPHRLADICEISGTRLIHISTDCVFSGQKGNYSESDLADAEDLYGRSKHIGEATYGRALTIRTSTIGHEFGARRGLLEWFITQKECAGYRRAIFSGLTTIEFANIVRDHILTRSDLSGLYHVGAEPIDKDSLLRLIASRYGLKTKIFPSDELVIDRSLNSERFKLETGYVAPTWPQLIDAMYNNQYFKLTQDV
jgi:dTDP-4-dehydrorhamnose reductase